MPETALTPLCNQMYDLIQRVRHELIEVQVIQAADDQMNVRPAAIRRRDNTYKVTFIRLLRWLHTFDKLNSDMDVQAVGAGARAIYELYLDLRWFKSKPDEVYLHRFREYSDVDRYMTGKKVVDRRGDSNSLLTDADIQPIIAGLQALDEKARRKGHASMRDLVLKFWGANGVDEPKWPSHWSGEGNLRSRAKAIGPECLDEYYQIYPTLCALVHPGPTPEVGLGLSDPLWRESLVSFSYGHAYRLARSATDIFIDLVEVRHHLKGYDAAVRQLDIWEQDAKRTMPAW